MPRYAAIDIGSNSVRLLVSEITPGKPPRVLAADRQVTRLGESVFRSGQISTESLDFLCSVLSRMAQTYRKHEVLAVRAVATSAVRDARNQAEFIRRSSEASEVPVEIISGQEEARLIHLGVQTLWPHPRKRILLVDVGGGSAEIMLSENGAMVDAHSRPLGAVRLTEVFLKNDPPSPSELRRMEEFIEEKLAPAIRRIGTGKFDRAIATSASASAIVCAVNRVPRARRETADRLRATTPQVRRLYQELSAKSLAQRRKMTGIGPRRAEIIVPGAAVFEHVLKAFGLPRLYYLAAGVRDGIVADLSARGVGRELSRLDRDQRAAVEGLARRFGVPLKHSRKVADFANYLFESLAALHKLPPLFGKSLEAASHLRDIGHYISDTSHHKHSWYVVTNSDLPGFTQAERIFVAVLCRYHRKSMPQPRHTEFQVLSPEHRRAIQYLYPILRLADALDRSRDQRVTGVDCTIRENSVDLLLQSEKDAALEQWASERVGETFRQVYDRTLNVSRGRKPS
jgi:exopolyphosphatase/guanosine-5'-triphosphate,3'-diphosphate pyrophosphatase